MVEASILRPITKQLLETTKDETTSSLQPPPFLIAALGWDTSDLPDLVRVALQHIKRIIEADVLSQDMGDELAQAIAWFVRPSTGAAADRAHVEEVRRWFVVVTNNEKTKSTPWSQHIATLQPAYLKQQATQGYLSTLQMALNASDWVTATSTLQTLRSRGLSESNCPLLQKAQELLQGQSDAAVNRLKLALDADNISLFDDTLASAAACLGVARHKTWLLCKQIKDQMP